MQQKNTKSLTILLITGFLQATGVYFLIIKYALSSFHPVTQPELFLDVATQFLHPEIDIPLYMGGFLFIPAAGLLFYWLLKRFHLLFSDHDSVYIASAYLRISFAVSSVTAYIVSQTNLSTDIVSACYIVFLISFDIFCMKIPVHFLAGLSKSFTVLFDVCTAVLLLALSGFILATIYGTSYFRSPEFLTAVHKEGYAYITGFSAWDFTLVLAVSFYVLLMYFRPLKSAQRFFGNKMWTRFIDLTVISLIIAAVSIIVPWEYANNAHFRDYAGVIGPLNDILGGKTIMVNTYSQYGLLMVYVSSLLFRIIPLTYNNFFLLNYAVTIIGFILIYIALRLWFRTLAIPVFWVFLALLHQHFARQTNSLFYCSQTFLRFGWWIFLFLYFAYKHTMRVSKNKIMPVESMLVAIGVFWAFDIGVYILAAYSAYLCILAIQQHSTPVTRFFGLLKSFVVFGVNLLTIFVCINGFSYIKSGKIPMWQDYLLHTRLFAINGFGMLTVPLIGPYTAIIILDMAIVLYILRSLIISGREKLQNNRELPLLVFVTVYAIFQHLYFIGESVPGNLHFTMLPDLILFCWVLSKITSTTIIRIHTASTPTEKILSGSAILCSVLIFCVITTIAIANFSQLYPQRGPIAYYTRGDFYNNSYKQSISWLKVYLKDIPPYKRTIAIISEENYLFLMETQSTNIIDSGNNYYFVMKSQYQMLCDQLDQRKPKVLFVQNDDGWGWVDYLKNCADKKYHFVENIGFLNRFEINNETTLSY